MLSKEDNELITNTDPGTPMGELFRRFWLPVALSEELPGPDSIPLRVRVLGEKLIAFRDTQGRPGLLDANCPHRGASLFFGRNEENGLRCIYHGWKFDVTGNCVDIPNAPEGPTYKDKIKITCYPCVEAGDLIWAFMGPADKKPPFPEFEWAKLPKSHRYITKFVEACNYLQAIEGDYDPDHARFLHTTLADGTLVSPLGPRPSTNGAPPPIDPAEPFPRAVGNRRITKEVAAQMGSGAGRGAIVDTGAAVLDVHTRQLPDGRIEAGAGAMWMMPIFCTAGIAGPNTYSTNMRVPIDNKSLMFYRLRWSYTPLPEKDVEEYKHGEWYYPALIPGSWKTVANVDNDYLVDRVAQRNFSYSGIKTFPLQDIAMIEDQWGPVADRTKEHLTSMDASIIYIRRKLLATAKALALGQEPEAPWQPEEYRYHRVTVIKEGTTPEEALDEARAKAKQTLVPEDNGSLKLLPPIMPTIKA